MISIWTKWTLCTKWNLCTVWTLCTVLTLCTKWTLCTQWTNPAGKGPRIFSIMARCSLLSWVWNRVNPRYSSNIIQPNIQVIQLYNVNYVIFQFIFIQGVEKTWDISISLLNICALINKQYNLGYSITLNKHIRSCNIKYFT